MRYDYVSVGFYTFDCLGWPVSEIPAGGGTVFIEDLTMAVSSISGWNRLAVSFRQPPPNA